MLQFYVLMFEVRGVEGKRNQAAVRNTAKNTCFGPRFRKLREINVSVSDYVSEYTPFFC